MLNRLGQTKTLPKMIYWIGAVVVAMVFGYWALRRYLIRKVIRENHWKRTEW